MTATSPRVLNLGFEPLAARAHAELGFKPFVVAGRSDREGLGPEAIAANEFVPVRDHCDPGEVLLALERRGLLELPFDVVRTDDEWAVMTAAFLASALDARGVPLPVAARFRDKHLQKQRLRDHGIPTAASVVIEDIHATSADTLARASYPGVVKPIAGAGVRWTTLAHTSADAQRAIAQAAGAGALGVPYDAFVIEEFVRGRELHVDGAVRGGEIVALGVGAYNINALEIQDGMVGASVSFDPVRHAELFADVNEFTTHALRALGLTDSVFHLELFQLDDGLVFGECAARPGGAMVVAGVRAKLGIDLYEFAAAVSVGLPLPNRRESRGTGVGWTFLPAPHGRIVTMPTYDEVMARSGVLEVVLELQPGEDMPDMRDTTGARAGMALLEGADEADVLERIEDLVEWFGARVRVEGSALESRA